MIIYRPHRGGLAESLAEAMEFETEEEMKKYIYEDWKKVQMDAGFGDAPFEIEDIIISEESLNDDRCGWRNTHHVSIKRLRDDEHCEFPCCIGFCATDYDKQEAV